MAMAMHCHTASSEKGKGARLLSFPVSFKWGSALGCSSGHSCVLLGLKYRGPVLVFSAVVNPIILRAPPS